MHIDTITAPAYWAPALINGDYSGLSDREMECLDAMLAIWSDKGWSVVSTTDDEPRFTWSYAMHGGDAQGGEVMDYVIHIRERADPALA